MAAKKTPVRRPSTPRTVTRSCRLPEIAWEKHKERAESLSIAPSRAMTMLVEAFAAGDIDLPGVRYVYENGARPEEAVDSLESEAGSEALEELGDDFDPESEL